MIERLRAKCERRRWYGADMYLNPDGSPQTPRLTPQTELERLEASILRAMRLRRRDPGALTDGERMLLDSFGRTEEHTRQRLHALRAYLSDNLG